jgi:hypothetical protein
LLANKNDLLANKNDLLANKTDLLANKSLCAILGAKVIHISITSFYF